MIRRVAAMSVLFMACAPAFAGPNEDALAAYQKFFEAFTTDNHDQIAALFAPDALFYGTQSTEVVTAPEGVRQYFVRALSVSRGTVKATPFEQTSLLLSDSVVAISGKWQSERRLEGKPTPEPPAPAPVAAPSR